MYLKICFESKLFAKRSCYIFDKPRKKWDWITEITIKICSEIYSINEYIYLIKLILLCTSKHNFIRFLNK